MFHGEHNHTIDDKGRVNIPAKFRDDLQGTFIINRGGDHTLQILTMSEWEEEVARLRKESRRKRSGRNILRTAYSGLAEVSMDKQGRITIPQNLRDFAGLQKNVTIIGVGDFAEIWDQESWEKVKNINDESYDDLLEESEE